VPAIEIVATPQHWLAQFRFSGETNRKQHSQIIKGKVQLNQPLTG
jgi:hypothetical protein